MTRLTLANVKASRIPAVLNLTSTDSRLVQYVNEAQQRLLSRGNWVGSTQKYRFSSTTGCITLPRQVESILSAAVYKTPVTVRDEIYEFVEHGYGLLDETDGDVTQLQADGTAVTQVDITGDNNKVRVYSDLTEEAGTTVLIQGYDPDGNYVMTEYGGEWIEGERVVPQPSGQLSVKKFTNITGVIKPVTNGPIRLYQQDADTGTRSLLAVYEPDETEPSFRKYKIPGLSNYSAECQVVTLLVKLAHMPVSKDTDWLVIGNLPALKAMCKAVQLEEANEWDEARKFEASAVEELQKELSTYVGDATVFSVRMPSAYIYGGAVPNIL